jgi:pilus assembly protein CpaF
MVLMAGVDFPMRAIRQQISRALDLVVQIERFSDGARKVTSITEVQRMEGDTVTLQDIFEYRIDKSHIEVGGTLAYSGLRPTSNKFERHGVRLPSWMEEHNFGEPGAAPERQTVSAFPARPSRADPRRLGR